MSEVSNTKNDQTNLGLFCCTFINIMILAQKRTELLRSQWLNVMTSSHLVLDLPNFEAQSVAIPGSGLLSMGQESWDRGRELVEQHSKPIQEGGPWLGHAWRILYPANWKRFQHVMICYVQENLDTMDRSPATATCLKYVGSVDIFMDSYRKKKNGVWKNHGQHKNGHIWR